MDGKRKGIVKKATLVLLAGLASFSVAPAEPPSDAWIGDQASSALRAAGRLSMSAVLVDDGQVTLYGAVSSDRDRVRAGRAVGAIPGVARVHNLLRVVAPGREERPGRSRAGLDAGGTRGGARPPAIPLEVVSAVEHEALDAEDEVIRRNVEKALSDLDARVNAEVEVRVEDGVVWLSGSVPTWQGHASRLHATRSVTGVRTILNQLRVVPSDAARQ